MRKKAMTLVEVLISMVLLAIITAGVYATLAVVGGGTKGVLGLQGLNYARETMEKLRNAVSTEAARSSPLTAGLNVADPLPSGDFKDKFGGARTYDVIEVDENGDDQVDYRKVRVSVIWTD